MSLGLSLGRSPSQHICKVASRVLATSFARPMNSASSWKRTYCDRTSLTVPVSLRWEWNRCFSPGRGSWWRSSSCWLCHLRWVWSRWEPPTQLRLNDWRIMSRVESLVVKYQCEAGESRICPHFWASLPPAWLSLFYLSFFITCALCCRCRRKCSGMAQRRFWSPEMENLEKSNLLENEQTWQKRLPMRPKNLE